MSVSFLKHYGNFSITFNVILRSISGTGKVDNVIIFDILEHPQIVKSRFKINRVNINYTAFGKLFQIVTILLVYENV